MAEQIDLLIRLRESISAPTRRAIAALEAMRDKLRGAERATRSFERAQKKTNAALDAAKLRQHKERLQQTHNITKKFAGELGEFADFGPAGIAAIVALLGVALTAAVGKATLKVINLADEVTGGKLAKAFDGFGDKAKQVFSGLDVKPLLKPLQSVIDMFDTTTERGKTTKLLITTVFQPVIDGIANALPWIELFMLRFGIAGLKIWNALKPVRKAIDSVSESIGELIPGEVVLKSIEIAAWLLAIAFGILGASIMLALLPVIVLGALIVGAIMLIAAAWEWLKDIDLGQIAEDMVQGFIDGILGMVQWVKDAAVSVGSAAKNALKGVLGIKSPSRVFMELGGLTAEGFAGGLDASRGAVAASVEHMVRMPDVEARGGAGGGRTISIGAINVNGASDPRGVLRLFESELAGAIERAALTAGV